MKEQRETKNTAIGEIKSYIFTEEASEEKEWENLDLYFEDEVRLEKRIRENWERRPFMTELFSLLNESVKANASKKLRERFVLICDIVAKLYLKGGESRSWFWKIRHILYLF